MNSYPAYGAPDLIRLATGHTCTILMSCFKDRHRIQTLFGFVSLSKLAYTTQNTP